jgi:hypothetical protein
VARANAACHSSAAVMVFRDDADVFGHPAPVVPLGELEMRIAIAEVLRGQLDAGCGIAASLAAREAQCRAATSACRAMNFSVKMRRALSAKVLDLEADARESVRYAARRARHASTNVSASPGLP